MTETRTLELRFHGRVIDHLGIQMYQSPVAAVAELIANAWDADADRVEVLLPESLGDDAEKNSLRHKTNCTQPYVMACDAEAGVENLYKKIQLPEEWVERLTRELEEEIVERQASAGELRVSLAEERQKLLRAYYANAIPLELLTRDQDRITESEEKAKSELVATEADLEKWQEVLTLATGHAGSCHAACLKANPKVRRRFNQAVLKAVYVEDGKVKRAEYTDVLLLSSHARVRISGSRRARQDSNLRPMD
jgi:hypothetical protein